MFEEDDDIHMGQKVLSEVYFDQSGYFSGLELMKTFYDENQFVQVTALS